MRYLIILIFVLSSCNTRPDDRAIAQTLNQDSLVNELVKNDFLMYTDSSEIDSVRQSYKERVYI